MPQWSQGITKYVVFRLASLYLYKNFCTIFFSIFQIHYNETNLCKAISNAASNLVNPCTKNQKCAGITLPKMSHFKFVTEKMANSYYMYAGSQTQPPCQQTNWLISTTVFDVTYFQVRYDYICRGKSKN